MSIPLRLLLIEDNPEDAALLEARLASVSEPLELTTAESLAEAVDALDRGGYDAIILDLVLPDSSGLATFARMKLEAGGIPIIVLTSLSDESLGLKAVQAGAEDYLIKGQVHGALLWRAVQYAIERRRAAHRIEMQAQMLQQVGQAVVATDRSGFVTFWNPAAEGLFGWSATEASAHRFETLIRPAEDASLTAWRDAIRQGQPWSGDLRVTRRDGVSLSIRVTQTPMVDVGGDIIGRVFVSSDVTERRAAEDALRASEARLRLFVEQLPTALWTTDRELCFTSVLGSLLPRVGLGELDLLGRKLTDFAAGGAEAGGDAARRALEGHTETLTVEWGGLALDMHMAPYRDAAGDIIGTIGIALDVSDRRRSELDAARYSEMLHAIIDTAPSAIMAIDENDRISLWNAEAERMLGWTAAEVVGGMPPHIPEHEQGELSRTVGALRRGSRIIKRQTQRVTRDGRLLDVLVSMAPLYDAEGRYRGAMGLVEDITAQRIAELRQQRLTAIIESSPDLVATFDVERRALYINRSGRRLIGLKADDPLDDLTLDQLCAPATAEQLRDIALPHALSNDEWTGEGELLTRGGAEVAVWMTIVSHRSQQGDLSFLSLVAHDISERRFLEEQLRQSQKMDAVGRLAGGVAHDFNNLLTAIAGHASMLREQVGENDTLGADIDEVLSAVDRASALTRQLLAFSRRQVLQPTSVDLNVIVRDMGRMLHRLIGEHIRLETTLASDLPRVRADRGQLEQVVMNLVVNARDAMPQGGIIDVRTTMTDIVPDSAEGARGVAPGSYVELTVTDSGVGMDDTLASRIFEPFFTTKEQGKGTGLGLPTVYGIVTQSGGFVLVDSAPGEGARFRVLLPRAAHDAQDDAVGADRGKPETVGSELVLLVEDEPAVRRLGRRVLERRGYHVLEAESGADAIRVFEGAAPDIALLVSDVVMPGMSGAELARRLREMKPTLKVLFTSGYTADAIARHGVLDPGIAFLEKPFTPDTLAAKVRQVIEGRSD